MRISHAERNEIADTLSKHFAEGRLDSDEFDERVGRVMNAKTRGDVAGVLDDLPRLGPPEPPPARHRPIGHWILAVVLVLAVASFLATPPYFHVPWLLVAFIAFLVWRRLRWRSHWNHRDLASRQW